MSATQQFHPVAAVVRDYLRDAIGLDPFIDAVRALAPDGDGALADAIVSLTRCAKTDLAEAAAAIEDMRRRITALEHRQP